MVSVPLVKLLSVGGYEVIAFEKNREMWSETQTVLLDHILFKENQKKVNCSPYFQVPLGSLSLHSYVVDSEGTS